MAGSDRRFALAGLVASAGLLIPGCKGRDRQGGGGEGDVTANEDLMREHGVLRRILILYRELAPRLAADPGKVDGGALRDAADLFRRFGEAYHEQSLEEQHIFPRVREAGGVAAGLVDILLVQHRRGREINDFVISSTRTGKVGAADGPRLATALSAFSRMYEAHAAREDTIIFPAFKAKVGDKAYKELGDQFEEIEKKTFGGDGFDMALDKVQKIEAALGLSDLASFTAPAP